VRTPTTSAPQMERRDAAACPAPRAPARGPIEVAEREDAGVPLAVDAATERLYYNLLQSRVHGPVIARLNALRNSHPPCFGRLNATLAIAPGAFYREFPQAGADGRLLTQEAARLGCPTEVIPTASTGGLDENARTICRWLAARPDERIILASVSKGGSDVKMATARPEAGDAFRRVVAWINVSGILSGTPLVNWLMEHKLHLAFFRALCWWRGYRFDVVRDLRHGRGSLLDIELRLPPHMKLVNLVGFPLEGDTINRLSRKCHQRLAPLGPNDGAILLSEVGRLPGVTYPVWRADHYLRPGWELRNLARAVLVYLGEELSLFESAEPGRAYQKGGAA
jgi:hypothetical protein